MLQIAGFLDNSLVNGEGIRSVLFVSGCRHNCEGCQNIIMQNYNYGDKLEDDEILKRIKSNLPIINGVTFSGGEPFDQASGLLNIATNIKAIGLNIWSYTGYTYEEICGNDDMLTLLKLCDVLVDGKFIKDLSNTSLKYIGSSNQRIIDVQESLKEDKMSLWKE